ncbi:ATP-grasp domain-containing protein [Lacimicrobium alkaliphilum]|uniref:Prokaryotic glutathione synthetase ATP-binding domain-containing protein n=1 Tax=Lacimicrobium alkaliphilum TaxID=1526571 RepID=A0ABQ1RG79_9ALTE|nr:hypothetical protein [Lacimicrobium alkaliphilum]GGD69348.1 hypothetical protein GCM10011357_25530 [Lacimicrobium alkaliphilum]
MKRCVFLSMDDIGDYYVYDNLLISPMAEQGWQVTTMSWKEENTDWSQFDAVILRSCWDYQQFPEDFLHRLAQISESTTLFNDLETVRWNISKRYLKELEKAGIPIVPTVWQEQFDPQQIQSAFAHFDTDELIIKPLISASAEHTYRLGVSDDPAQLRMLESVFSERAHMLQPFISNVIDDGEVSLFFFGSRFSHAIRKVPKSGDFRVQEEHGGQLHVFAPDAELLALAGRTLKVIPGQTLYARLDFICCQYGYVVMELELIEPSLYFNMDPGSAQRFVQALTDKTGNTNEQKS